MIKSFKEFQNLYESIGSLDPIKFLTPEQIEWCNKHIEGEWSVNDKGEVTIDGHIKFKDKTFERFEVQFADTNYNFDCSGCTKLTTLEGAPQKVLTFNCSGCTSLTTLQGAPQEAALFNCSGCTSLTSLQGAPQAEKYFNCVDCPKLDPEEVNLLKEDPELFKKWLASGTSFKEWKEKKRGMITGTRYGL